MGAVVTVESPFPPYALPRVWKWVEDSHHQMCDDFSPKTLDQFIDHWDGLVRGGQRSWAVFVDNELGGALSSSRSTPIRADFHAIFKRSFWGQGIATQAFKLALGQLFDEGIQKITTGCFFDNHAVLGLFGKLGFEREGRLRDNTFRNGKSVDQVIVGLTASRFAELFGKAEEAHVVSQ